MKTAISIPDATFKSAESVARRRKVSRSALYTQALEEFLEKQQRDHVKESLDQVYKTEDSRMDPVVAKLQSKAISKEKW